MRSSSGKPSTSELNIDVQQVVSGGQTGVDRAGLDAALACGFPVGGWCPAGRRSEAGPIPQEYPLQETESAAYQIRTEWNVRDSDGTLIIVRSKVTGGTSLTRKLAMNHGKPIFVQKLKNRHVDLMKNEAAWNAAIAEIRTWLTDNNIRILNIAGPRASSEEALYEDARRFLIAVLTT